MIAFSVMVTVLCGSLAALISGNRSLDMARCSTLAAQIMQSRIETLRLMNWSRIQSETTRDFSPDELKSWAPTDAAQIISRFTLHQQVSQDDPRAVVTILLTVRWNNIRGNPHERTFAMRYAKNGLYDYYVNAP